MILCFLIQNSQLQLFLDVMGNPFDRANPLRTTENIGALRKHVNLSFKGGAIRTIPFIGLGVAAYVAGGQALAGDLVGAGGTLLDEAVSEVGLDTQPAASGTLTDAPAQHQAILERQANPTVADKIIRDPLNELEYLGNQVMQFFGGAVRMGSQAGF